MRKVVKIIFTILFLIFITNQSYALFFNSDLDYLDFADQFGNGTAIDYFNVTGKIQCKDLDGLKKGADMYDGRVLDYFKLSYDCDEYGIAYKFYVKGKEIPGTIFADYVMYGASWGGIEHTDEDICEALIEKKGGLFKKYNLFGKSNNFSFDCSFYEKVSKYRQGILSLDDFTENEMIKPIYGKFYENGLEVDPIYWGAKIDDIYMNDYNKKYSREIFYSFLTSNADHFGLKYENNKDIEKVKSIGILINVNDLLQLFSKSTHGLYETRNFYIGNDIFFVIPFNNGKILTSNQFYEITGVKPIINKSIDDFLIGDLKEKIEPKTKIQYIKQKLISSDELKKKKQDKYIKQIDLFLEKADKKKLEEIFNNIQKIKSDNQIIKYMEASIYLQLNKTN